MHSVQGANSWHILPAGSRADPGSPTPLEITLQYEQCIQILLQIDTPAGVVEDVEGEEEPRAREVEGAPVQTMPSCGERIMEESRWKCWLDHSLGIRLFPARRPGSTTEKCTWRTSPIQDGICALVLHGGSVPSSSEESAMGKEQL